MIMDRNNSLSIITRKITPDKIIITDSPLTSAKKRRRSPVQLFKVALFMIRRRSSGRTNHPDLASGGGNMFNRLVGSMRPLHLQSNGESPAESQPESPSMTSSSSSEVSSRYGSAANLQEMDKSESRYASAVNLRDMDIEDSVKEIDGGDEMIDVKAEVFIAKFYEQIRIQRLNSINRRYNEMVERSIA